MAINRSIQNLISSNRKLSNTDVNNLFYYFYGRTATAAEKSYWSQKTSNQLSSALTPNAAQFKSAGYYKDVLAKPSTTATTPTTTTKTATPTTTKTTAPAATTTKQATLSSPDGKYKTVVDVGSQDAKTLQAGGWTLGDSGKTKVTTTVALNRTAEGAVKATTPATTTPATTTTAQKATLTSPDGAYKTVVNIGSSEAKQLQGSGWVLGATGKSTIDVNAAIGQIGKVTPTTPTTPTAATTQTPAAQNIPFKSGLSDIQKQSITNLAAKPISQWTETDKKNWAYATNNAALPMAVGVTTTATAPATAGIPAGTTAGKQFYRVGVDLFDAATGQRITSTDWANNWSGKATEVSAPATTVTPAATAEEVKTAEIKAATDTAAEDEKARVAALKNALSIIDASNLPDDLKQMYKTVVESYPEGVEVNTQEIINAFNKIKNETIDPYFRGLVAQETANIQNQFDYLEQQRALELEQERAQTGATIRQAQGGLESSGMTFTGEAVKQLGAESAYPQTGGIPGQVPFGGTSFYEGEVQQANRLLSTSNAARYQNTLKQLGLGAESALGSTGIPSLGGYAATGGVQGSLDIQKQQQYGSTLSNLLDQYYNKQQANTNLTY